MVYIKFVAPYQIKSCNGRDQMDNHITGEESNGSNVGNGMTTLVRET